MANEVFVERGGVPPRSKGFETVLREEDTFAQAMEALESTPVEGVSDDRSHASAFTAVREEVIFGGSGQ